MCGRFNLYSSMELLLERFDLKNAEWIEWYPRFNIAPSQDVLAVVQGENGNKGGFLKWGLVPSWASDPKIGYKMINARAETLTEKPSFKHLLSRRRCLIIADGFYEWKREGDGKQPYHIRLKNGEPFSFAGLWDRWEKNGEKLQTCTIITTEANKLMKPIHDRMPVILTKETENRWLDRTIGNSITDVLKPYDYQYMEAYPVSSLVNSPKNEGEELINSL
ncbi:SOS response-associated peptidase [Bacillus sp. FJAT-49736]|uniref:SOS response-associated peptidase n=1 Tax=Bacillus sp. FJAT-49736 TaxID=2833582 RepID=UPI001BC9892E|nr:SOS response-associated peptidase [Bacillus sp. FJAT-49736]MBS4174548.1 SOS response-associated peptidase [Bacillus sp. FJAT-49736]